MSEGFILKAYKAFQRHVDTIIEKMAIICLLFYIYFMILLFILLKQN